MKAKNKAFLQYNSSSTYATLTRDSGMYLSYNIIAILDIIQVISSIIFSMIVGAVFSWILVLFILIIILFSFLGTFIFKKTQSDAFENFSKANHEFQSKINNLLDGYPRLYFANKQKLLNEQISNEINNVYKASLKKTNVISFVNLGSRYVYELIGNILIIGSALLIFHFTNQRTLLGFIDIGFLWLITHFVSQLKGVGPSLISNIKGYLSNRNIVKSFDLKLALENNEIVIDEIREIKIQNLDFKYPNEDKQIFQNLNLKFKKGEKYAIIGESGSGKSTLLKLLNGLYVSNSGEILINNHNINAIRANSLRENLTFVDSKNLVFPTNIINNVTFYEKNFDPKKLENALDKVNLLSELKDNYLNPNFDVTNNLSLGQKQRLVLARLFYLNKKWIILDESLSNLDDKNTSDIQERIIEDPDLTLILVTHHLKKKIIIYFIK
ncbi:ABC transporter ATP-binding protein [Mycoplasmoides fastidiosum]|uniref:ATP-binding cassette domain-containing protein n=1 Tax=Mycoplasmoides fastidiosum TaxID=92758 RepID=UPI002115518C|nr:ABC transporter ATP-binding protein [Mycoplasmoides fastidiosum]UUD37416.1 ABC transporter ATP-binding protein/permease [Mycoplasmoides fastidiosum]